MEEETNYSKINKFDGGVVSLIFFIENLKKHNEYTKIWLFTVKMKNCQIFTHRPGEQSLQCLQKSNRRRGGPLLGCDAFLFGLDLLCGSRWKIRLRV